MGNKVRFLAAAMISLTTIAGCAAQTEGDEEMSGESQDRLLAGRRISEREAATLIRAAGFPANVVGKMLCTIKYESNFYERASNKNSNGSVDYGLFQVNSVHLRDKGCPTTGTGLYDAAANAKCAAVIYKSQGINAWYGYKKHKAECDRYPAPPGLAGDPPSTPSTPTTPAKGDDDTGEGGCFSGTLDEMVPARTCVESKFDGKWFQCKDGRWFRGGDTGTGPFGACVTKHPL